MNLAKPVLAAAVLSWSVVGSLELGYGQRRAQSQTQRGKQVLWVHPGNISARDLTHGPGAADLMPVAPFTFIEEDKSGESPKFEVRDARGVTWTVKLGEEAQAETVATRLVWSVGYFAEEAYYFRDARIENLPKLSRGMKYVTENNVVVGARFEPKREHLQRGANWDWADNPFSNTRQLSKLKILMILITNGYVQALRERINQLRKL